MSGSPAKPGPKVLFYVQHLLGIGHIARASRIASAMKDDGFDVTVVTGGLPVPGFPADGIPAIALPPLVANNAGFSGLADADGRPADEAFLAQRRDRLLEIFHRLKPDMVIIEAFPFGRRQMRFELIPLIEAIENSTPRPKLITSVRDIVQQRTKPGRNEETVALVKAHFDHVLVHGDENFVSLSDSFPLADEIADRIVHTGLVAAPPAPASPEKFDIVVSAGGGAVGAALVNAAIGAARQHIERSWCVIAGPNLPEADFQKLLQDSPSNVEVVRFRKDFPSLLRGAKVSVSQAGYNTVCDLLQAGCKAILVPFTQGGETEQAVRAQRLEEMGLAVAISEDCLNAHVLSNAVAAMLESPSPSAAALDLDGARKTASYLRSIR
ncbi:putative glycosyltransferase [Ochrobactrum daejeonense]|uniref:Putative glycosyltransferase n=1 Tax=Brucella daejeonensis TaxID=659015 RepID=A0A7W9AUP4_9HYPH|nr:glycosyltransferase [Brucella daejeonensis]MBB5700777.1 putative glycosyltransferase [Brucella daejeonensis]NKB79416.1 glycosyl transferase [Brucella daejeonensis]